MALQDFARHLSAERKRDTVNLAHYRREAARSSGVCMSGMGPTPFAPRAPRDLIAAAEVAWACAEGYAASALGRFKACIMARLSERPDAELGGQLMIALACGDRGLESFQDRALASDALDVAETFGADVRSARAALVDLQPLQHAAE